MHTAEMNESRPERQPPPYRTAFEVGLDLAEATDRVREQLRSWLKGKELDVDRFDARETTIGKGTALLYVLNNAASGWQLREGRDDGVTWVSTVSVARAEAPGVSWVSLDVRALPPTGHAPSPKPPNLARLLLDALDARDGNAVLTPRPIIVAEAQVDQLLEDVVCSDQRRLPAVIAASATDVAFERWQEVVANVARDLSGLASIYLLNPAATVAFNQGIGPTHWIGPGAIRTYLTDVDPAVTEDAVRHRVLGRRRIESEPLRARRALAALPRQLAANSLPAQATRGLDLAVRDFVRDRSSAALASNGVEELKAEVEELYRSLELAWEKERQQEATIGQLQDQLLDIAGELEITQGDVAERDDLIRALRRRLTDAELYTDAYTPSEETTELPKSFADVLDRMEELAPYVIFTGDPGATHALDEQPQNTTWAQTCWRALLALRDYAEHQGGDGFDGDFQRWCKMPVGAGRTISPGKVARGESETVRNNRRWASMRTFPVPVTVSSDGRIFMEQHIRLGQSTSVSPRMYFHDDTTKSGTVCVGFIGRHPENTKTS